MEYKFDDLVNNYEILLQVRDYILTVDRKVLKKNANGKYEQVSENDKFAKEMLELTKDTDRYVNEKSGLEIE